MTSLLVSTRKQNSSLHFLKTLVIYFHIELVLNIYTKIHGLDKRDKAKEKSVFLNIRLTHEGGRLVKRVFAGQKTSLPKKVYVITLKRYLSSDNIVKVLFKWAKNCQCSDELSKLDFYDF